MLDTEPTKQDLEREKEILAKCPDVGFELVARYSDGRGVTKGNTYKVVDWQDPDDPSDEEHGPYIINDDGYECLRCPHMFELKKS